MGCILLSRNPSAISTSKAWPKDKDMSRTAGSLSWVLATLPSSAYPASGHQYVSTFKTQRFKRHISYATSSPRELQRIWERAGSFQWPWLLFQAYLCFHRALALALSFPQENKGIKTWNDVSERLKMRYKWWKGQPVNGCPRYEAEELSRELKTGLSAPVRT